MRRVRAAAVFVVAFIAAATGGCAPEPLLSGPAHPPMWEARNGETRIIMIGSVHQLPAALDWQDDRVRQAMSDADQLWLELAPDDLDRVPALFRRMASDEQVPPLARRIGEARALQVENAASGIGLSDDEANGMESWAMALIVGAQSANDAGLSRAHGVETVLARAFIRAGKPVRGLERPEDQLGAFDGLTPAAQDLMLGIAADSLADSRGRIGRLLSAWATGDVDELERLANAEVARVPGLADALVANRNIAWTRRIADAGGQAGNILIAVGSGHLVGESGLPAQLAARGYVVRRIQPGPMR